MSFSNSLAEFRQRITEGNSFISLAHKQGSDGNYELPENTREFITESAFLRMFIAWETFLEEAFIKYMVGELSITGNTIIRYVSPVDGEHAHKILIGTQKYVDWANPEIVRKLASMYFENGGPFNLMLSSINNDLLDLRTVRNSAAHLSSTTGQKLDALCSRFYSMQCTNMTASKFLLDTDPNNTTQTILQYYIDIIDIAAEGICNA